MLAFVRHLLGHVTGVAGLVGGLDVDDAEVGPVGQRSQRGVIEAADAHHLTLRINRHGGSASYVLAREQIERIDLD